MIRLILTIVLSALDFVSMGANDCGTPTQVCDSRRGLVWEMLLKYLPTKAGVNSNPKLLIHNGSHPIYTNQVKMDLDRVWVRAAQDAASENVWKMSDYQAENRFYY